MRLAASLRPWIEELEARAAEHQDYAAIMADARASYWRCRHALAAAELAARLAGIARDEAGGADHAIRRCCGEAMLAAASEAKLHAAFFSPPPPTPTRRSSFVAQPSAAASGVTAYAAASSVTAYSATEGGGEAGGGGGGGRRGSGSVEAALEGVCYGLSDAVRPLLLRQASAAHSAASHQTLRHLATSSSVDSHPDRQQIASVHGVPASVASGERGLALRHRRRPRLRGFLPPSPRSTRPRPPPTSPARPSRRPAPPPRGARRGGPHSGGGRHGCGGRRGDAAAAHSVPLRRWCERPCRGHVHNASTRRPVGCSAMRASGSLFGCRRACGTRSGSTATPHRRRARRCVSSLATSAAAAARVRPPGGGGTRRWSLGSTCSARRTPALHGVTHLDPRSGVG